MPYTPHLTSLDTAQYYITQLAKGREVETSKMHYLIYLTETTSLQHYHHPFHTDTFQKHNHHLPRAEKFSHALSHYNTEHQNLLHEGQNIGGTLQNITVEDKEILDHTLQKYGQLPRNHLAEIIQQDIYFASTPPHRTIIFRN